MKRARHEDGLLSGHSRERREISEVLFVFLVSMLQTPESGRVEWHISQPFSLTILPCPAALHIPEQVFVCPSIILATKLPLNPPSFEGTNAYVSLSPPLYFSMLDEFQDHVDLVEVRVVNDLVQAYDVRVPNLLENGDLPLGLVFWRDGDLSKTALSPRVPLYDLDGHPEVVVLWSVLVSCNLDLAVNSPSDLGKNLILVDELASGRLVLDSCLVSSDVG